MKLTMRTIKKLIKEELDKQLDEMEAGLSSRGQYSVGYAKKPEQSETDGPFRILKGPGIPKDTDMKIRPELKDIRRPWKIEVDTRQEYANNAIKDRDFSDKHLEKLIVKSMATGRLARDRDVYDYHDDHFEDTLDFLQRKYGETR